MTRRAYVHRLSAKAPDDVSALEAGFASGAILPEAVIAVMGKTEGNGCVNDFTRGFATRALHDALLKGKGAPVDACFVMSGGTEGALSPHFIVFEAREVADPPAPKALALGRARTPCLPFEHLGRLEQVDQVASAVRAAMREAGIASVKDVHFVQIKCPLLTADRVAAAEARGAAVTTRDTLKSMAFSRAASALGAAVALGEVERESLRDIQHRPRLEPVLQPRIDFGRRRIGRP